MKRLAVGLLIGFVALLILQPVSIKVNSLFNNQPTCSTLVAEGFPIPPIPPTLVAEGFPIPPIPPTNLVSGAIWVA